MSLLKLGVRLRDFRYHVHGLGTCDFYFSLCLSSILLTSVTVNDTDVKLTTKNFSHTTSALFALSDDKKDQHDLGIKDTRLPSESLARASFYIESQHGGQEEA